MLDRFVDGRCEVEIVVLIAVLHHGTLDGDEDEDAMAHRQENGERGLNCRLYCRPLSVMQGTSDGGVACGGRSGGGRFCRWLLAVNRRSKGSLINKCTKEFVLN